MRHRGTGRFVSALLAVSLLCSAWLATAVATDPSGLIDCDSGAKDCSPGCIVLCVAGSSCIQCACTAVCSPLTARLQQPLQLCDVDNTLAQTCDVLSGIKPRAACKQAGKCQPGFVCKEYLCGSECLAKCVPAGKNAKKTEHGKVASALIRLPDSLPAGPFCPDNTTIADWCTSGAQQEDVDAKCWDLACEDDGVMCGEFRCRNDTTDGCGVTCVTGAVHTPYRCPSGRAGRKCNPPENTPTTCNPPCDEPGTFCAPLYCGEGCSYTCLKAPWYTPPTYICPNTLAYVPECKPAAGDDAACSTTDCGQAGRMCRFLDCGSGCQATCTTDPSYIEPQPSPFLCPADNSTAMQCFSTDGAAACNKVSEGVPPALTCADGTLCGEFKCGGDSCKAMCVVDPYYRPYICPATGSVAKFCDLQPTEQSYDCAEDCAAKGREFFCGIFECDGKCAPTCIANPWYEPPTYICSDPDQYIIAKECTPSDPGIVTCATIKCAAGHVCGAYDCTADPNVGSTVVRKAVRGRLRAHPAGNTGRRKLAGTSTTGDSCQYRCVKDPWWMPPPVYRCSSGEIATSCGQIGDTPLPPVLKPASTRPQGITKMTRNIIWAACDPECTEDGYFCMMASCGDSGTCSATCVKDENYVPPPPPPLLCADNYNSATLCKIAIDDATCQKLACSDNGFTCAAADCGDGCTTRCVTQGWFVPGIPTTPISYYCDNGSIAEPCSFEPAKGQATCKTTTCDAGMMCGDYICGGTCSPMCVPMPPPTMFPWIGGWDEIGGGGNTPCPDDAPIMQCKADLCAATTCPEGETCYQSLCNCTAICMPPRVYKGAVNIGKVKAGKTGGSDKLKGLKTHNCVKGVAVEPKTCSGDPCDDKKCNEKTHTCVREFCGGCLATCVPKEPACKNNATRRGCISTANFCMAAKCGVEETCLPSQCNNCAARCFGPCGPGRYASRASAKCERCPRGFACSGAGSPDPDPVPCNNGFYAPKMGMRRCWRCPRGQTTPPSPNRKGHWKCT